MARRSKLSADEIEAIESGEMAEASRIAGRKVGFSMMDVRDRGWARMSNGVVIQWPVPEHRRKEELSYRNIPEGKFLLHGKETILLDADEMLRYLRWV